MATPTAYYKFESGALTTDSVAGTYTLTNNNTVTSVTGGIIGNASEYNGTNQSMNNNSILGAISYPKFFDGWVEFDSVATSDRTFFALGDGTTHYYVLKVRDSDDHLVFRSNNATQAADVDTGIVATTAHKYHIVVNQNSATSVDIWVDNVHTNTAATTFSATVSQMYLGYLGRSSVWFLDGRIDELAVGSGTYTDADVSFRYNGGAPGVNQQYPYVETSKANFFAMMG